MAEERSGFLGRWSRRKLETLQGRTPDEPVLTDKATPAPVAGAGLAAPKSGSTAFAPAPVSVPAPAAPWRAADRLGMASSPALASGPASESAVMPAVPDANANAPAPEKSLSLEDVKALTQHSDFKPFMARNVGADVRNAAMKKLFADPHYNVMDGLDIYIDDYSVADPLPQAMLRQMASAQFLKLFDDEEAGTIRKNAAANPAFAAQGGAAVQTDATAAADDSLNPPDAKTSEYAAPSEHGAVLAPSAEPLTAVRADSFVSLFADHASQAEPAAGASASQDNHAHSHLRLQPDHAAPAPNAGHGTS